MEQNKQKYYITTAIAYASKKPHFGNTYEAIMTDAMARYKKQMGFDVFFCTGTDEHGQKIEDLAKDAGITPKAYVDGVAGEIRELWDNMDVDYDHLSAPPTIITRRLFRRSLRNSTIRVIYIKENMRAGIALPASPSLPKRRQRAASAPTAADPYRRQRRRLTSSR